MATPIVPYSDATALLGQVHSTLQNRDAVHVACIQVELAECYNIETPAQMLRSSLITPGRIGCSAHNLQRCS